MKLKDIYIFIVIFNIIYWSHYFDLFGEMSLSKFDENDEDSKSDDSLSKHSDQHVDPVCGNFTEKKLALLAKKKIDPNIVEFKLNPESMCSDSRPMLFVYIFNKVHSFDKRKTIRKTWANRQLFPNVKFAFILGLSKDESVNVKINKEFEMYKDVIQGTFVVSTFNFKIGHLLLRIGNINF